jgi:hypothetical protein
MNARQKAAFLRKEGWTSPERDWWTHPTIEWFYSLDGAFKCASRRRSQRDTRRLKKAGFYYSDYADAIWEPGWFTADHQFVGPKSEALQLLEAQG